MNNPSLRATVVSTQGIVEPDIYIKTSVVLSRDHFYTVVTKEDVRQKPEWLEEFVGGDRHGMLGGILEGLLAESTGVGSVMIQPNVIFIRTSGGRKLGEVLQAIKNVFEDRGFVFVYPEAIRMALVS